MAVCRCPCAQPQSVSHRRGSTADPGHAIRTQCAVARTSPAGNAAADAAVRPHGDGSHSFLSSGFDHPVFIPSLRELEAACRHPRLMTLTQGQICIALGNGTSRRTRHHGIRFDISGHHTACSDDGPTAQTNAGQHDRTKADPDVILNNHALGLDVRRCICAAHPGPEPHWNAFSRSAVVVAAHKGYAAGDQREITDLRVRFDHHLFAYVALAAEVDALRRPEPASLADVQTWANAADRTVTQHAPTRGQAAQAGHQGRRRQEAHRNASRIGDTEFLKPEGGHDEAPGGEALQRRLGVPQPGCQWLGAPNAALPEAR
mmetsp:Transcript_50952/g.119422  ORF Transcript_50952/g.119422 Transcript_50952/m.119422 type:complete len:317 (+) Transcript_50952:2908-3858(+)